MRLIAARSPGARELYLNDQAVRAAAEADPSALVRHDGLLLIDEIQRVPELLLAIKREVYRFLLTGSARLLGLKDLPDALPGRAEKIELWPVSPPFASADTVSLTVPRAVRVVQAD